mmetsp:Transcript_48775/g.114173  ORF Transcript_48775/g.114173 Transcript_48775/m.114173 type:complete len:263 (+) Transcript_48775:143-931(+)
MADRAQCSEHLPLLGGVHVRPQYPLVLGLGLLGRAELDLVELHLEARAELEQVDGIVRLLFVHVVAERDVVLAVDARDDARRVRAAHGEEVLKHRAHALAERRGEVLEDEVREDLRHVHCPLNVVAQDRVGEVEVGGRPVGHVRDDEPVRLAARLMHDHEVREALALCDVHQLLHARAAAVHPMAVREDEAQLLQELGELRARVMRCGDEYPRVGHARARVLVVQHVGLVLVRVVKRQVALQLVRVLPQLRGDRLFRVERLL